MLITTSGGVLRTTGGSAPTYTPSAITNPLADNVHPRLLVTANGYSHGPTVSDIRAKLAADTTIGQGFVDRMDDLYAANGAASHYHAMNFAYLYLVLKDGAIAGITPDYTAAQYGARAKAQILSLSASGLVASYWQASGPGGAQSLLAADWIWDLLDSSDKAQIGAWAKLDTSSARELFNSQGVAQASTMLLGRLLFHGSGVETSWVGDVDTAYQQYFRESYAAGTGYGGYTNTNSDYGAGDGGFCQGLLYGTAYTATELVVAEEGYRTAKGITKATHYGTSATDALRYYPRWFLHQLIPDAYPRTTNGSYPNSYAWIWWKGEKCMWPQTTPHAGQPQSQLEAMTGLFEGVDSNMPGLAKWILQNRVSLAASSGANTYYEVACVPHRFVIGNPTTSAITPGTASEPVSKWHGRGWLTSRLTWDNTINEPWVSLTATQKWSGSHGMTWPGNLILHRKGPVMWMRGDNEGHGFIGKAYAGSSMQFPDRLIDHTTVVQGEDNFGSGRRHNSTGGTEWPYSWGADRIGDMTGTVRTSLASGSRNVDYAFVDLSRRYSSDKTNCRDYYDATGRISAYTREVVYFKPATEADPMRLFVYDEYTTLNKKYRPEAIWCPSTAATFVDGTTSSGPSRGLTGTHGKTQSTDASVVTWNNGLGSKAWLTRLAPTSNFRMMVAGGAGSTGDTYYGTAYDGSYPQGDSTDSHELENIYGIYENSPWSPRAPKNPSAALRPYYGWGIVSIIDESQSVADTAGSYSGAMLTAFEVREDSESQSTTLAVPGASGCIGGIIGTQVAVFATGGISQTSLAFRLESAGTYTVHIARLNPSATRTIEKGANISSIVNVVGGGTTYTAGAGGDLFLTVVVGSSGSSAANTITLS